jgi:hypothetical protein
MSGNKRKAPPSRLRRSHRHIPEGFEFLLDGKPHPLQMPSVSFYAVEFSRNLTLSELDLKDRLF